MGACCSLFSRTSAEAAPQLPGKRGAKPDTLTPLGELSLVLCSQACGALVLMTLDWPHCLPPLLLHFSGQAPHTFTRATPLFLRRAH